MKRHRERLGSASFLSILLVLLLTLGVPFNSVAKVHSSFRIEVDTSILPPLVKLDNSSSSYALLYGPYNTSALITVQANISSASNYSSVLMIISNYSSTLEVNLEVYSYTNIIRILNATVRLRNETDATFDQIIIEEGQITQEKASTPYTLNSQETIYLDIINLQSNSTGTTYIYTRLRVQFPDTSTFVLQTIAFKFT